MLACTLFLSRNADWQQLKRSYEYTELGNHCGSLGVCCISVLFVAEEGAHTAVPECALGLVYIHMKANIRVPQRLRSFNLKEQQNIYRIGTKKEGDRAGSVRRMIC